MERYILKRDIPLITVKASSFPNGVCSAHLTLHSLLPLTDERQFFGISFPNGNGRIVYKAAAESYYTEEAEKVGCEKFLLKKGEYNSITIPHYNDSIQSIGWAFSELLKEKSIDPQGCCVEMYLN